MGDYFTKFFDTSDFPARWYCGSWSDFLGWLHIVSDIAIFAAYFAIPVVLVYFARKRRDFPFTKLFWLFAIFILACGSVHLIEAVIFWHPIYRVSGMMKFITAVVSCATVIVLTRNAPRIMHLPSIAEANKHLMDEVSHRRAIEGELRRSKERLDAILSGTRSIVWTTNPEGGFATRQISWERYTGQIWSVYRGFGWADAIHEDDIAELRLRWQKSLESGEKHQATFRLWQNASQSYRACVAEAVPVRNEDGSIREWVGTVSDVEDQLRAETNLGVIQSELAKQKKELELIYEAAPVGMCLIDKEFRFLRVNDTLARITGLSKDEHLGCPVTEVLPELSEQLMPIFHQVFETGQPVVDREIVGRTAASRKTKTWLASYFPLEPDGDDNSNALPDVTAMAAFIQDITDRKTQERKLRESEEMAQAANQAKSEFLANMSHEIRTPMGAILGYADVLLGHLKDPDNRNCVSIIKRNGNHLLELLNDILDLSRIEAGKLDVEVELTPLPQLVADIHSLMAVRAEEKQIQFDVTFDGKVPKMIETDPTRLRQVLINLIGNAIKFTDEGEVILRTRFVEGENPPFVEFAVQDTGIGMTEEQQDRIFRPFSQADSSVTRQFGGSGLGLTISQRLVQMLDGEMGFESQSGEGSTFYVRLPVPSCCAVELIQPSLTVRQKEPESLMAKAPTLSCHILVVDDRRDVRHISQHFLEKAGATVATAECGREGVDTAIAARDAGKPFDLIVMDIQMPNIDGLQATSELRSAGIDWPIIALTADAMKGDRERCLNGGCDDYLTKPIDAQELIGMVFRYTQEISKESLAQKRAERIETIKEWLDNREA